MTTTGRNTINPFYTKQTKPHRKELATTRYAKLPLAPINASPVLL